MFEPSFTTPDVFDPGHRSYPADAEQRYRGAGYWTRDAFADFLPRAARSFASLPAVTGFTAAGSYESWTYRELHERASRAAARLFAAGVREGDRVIIQLPNILDYLVAVFAIFELGALPVFALPAHRHAELAHFAQSADASAFITTGPWMGFDHRGLARELRVAHPDLKVFIAGEDPAEFTPFSWDDAPDIAVPHPTRPETSVAFLQVSGGTTGVPKLIPRTHADYLYSVRASAEICNLDTTTRMLVVLPVSHNFTMSSPGVLGVLMAGGSVVLSRTPDPSTALGLVAKEKATMTSVVPPLLMTWLAHADAIGADLSSLKVIQAGGSKLPEAAARRVPEVFGCRLQQVFGMAEGLVNYTRDDDPADIVATTQGRPISPADEIAILDDANRPVPAGAPGHLFTRGPYTIRGYLNNVDASSFTEDGFYKTGDIVRQLPSGHLVVEGRAKDQINRAGEKVSAEEVENHLVTHPDIMDAAVVAVADERLGERTCAYIISARELTHADVRIHLKKRGVAAYKIPDETIVTDAFPVTGVGKISRRELRSALTKHSALHS
ncbi:(2,3-dihydroxybenzoyl)adenylate synthase [Corynebacterium auris]|uniref:(2,3-dihydroxybenzoyl)adenylate synthase n=1 Tax=Corynebacterium auris TaxID=44750 RepID=UPI0025B58387|nr:AMP-binding protein [Corynebacterium auris]WJY68447.1 2,3-dihydroxybenzoate-AMP ligase [Corynebacterium auris]